MDEQPARGDNASEAQRSARGVLLFSAVIFGLPILGIIGFITYAAMRGVQ